MLTEEMSKQLDVDTGGAVPGGPANRSSLFVALNWIGKSFQTDVNPMYV